MNLRGLRACTLEVLDEASPPPSHRETRCSGSSSTAKAGSRDSAPMTLRNRPGRGRLPIPAPGSWSPRRAAAGACVCRSCSAGCGSGVSEKAGAPCARGKAQRCAQRTIPRYRSGQNQPQASTATQSSAGIGPNGLLAPPHGLRISGRPLRPDRAYCKTARKFLCFILMKRIPRDLAVDHQHRVHVRRRRYGTI